MSKQVIVITGASSGFGTLMRETQGRNAPQVAAVAAFSKDNGVNLNAVELDVASDASVNAGMLRL
jgi:NADP-dependent 3-hydroxy acid dehydrogenase YdfG